MNILSFLGSKLVLLVCCLMPLWVLAQKDSVKGDFAVHLHGGIGMAYQDNTFAEQFIAANLNDNINFGSYMFMGLLGADIEYKRFGIELDLVSSATGNKSTKNAAVITNGSGVINLTYVIARFERINLKGLVGMEERMTTLLVQNELPSTVAYNTLVSKINFVVFNVGGDILWRPKPTANKHASSYIGLRLRYGRSLSNNGWSYVPVQHTNGGHLNTFLVGLIVGIGSRN